MRSENSGSKEDFGQIMSILACSSYEISYDFSFLFYCEI